ncbi:S-layer homology domain-containing protein [Paenibacillus roseipurpureus]|uniref:S-layer homology domain-containing protein n=1 Tax=Paenibacillus roseopurpureus TaxID=2918901 RepID=A0AA96RKS9_9BACL|nr:S-layer homology domain-containing protein [Paenibacillus sp. MBLB1832]WNR44674.1 S-layer homology domain-containing protein [Paenibacillus sp. MBLB1832]
MRQLKRKWMSLTIVLAMVLSMLPTLTANAAATISVTNLFVPGPGINIDSNNDSLVDRFTINPINVDFLINGIPDDQISNIFYEIYNLNTSQTATNATNKAVKSTSNSNQATFKNVQLTTGLNKITIKYGSSGSIASSPAYAYYTPVTNITNLKINGDDFVDGGFYPKQPPYSGVSITGTSLNAMEVEASLQGNTFQPSAFINGDFTFITNTNRPNELAFRPGDNKVTFAAKNTTNFYTANRSFVFDNGQAFAYNAQVGLLQSGPTTIVYEKLVDSPNLQDNSIADISVNASFKVPRSAGGVTRYVYADVFSTGMGGTNIHIDFTSGTPAKTPTGNLNNGTAANATIAKTNSASDPYDLYDLTASLPVNQGATYQELVFKFTDINNGVTYSKYNYSYVNPNQPYVDHVGVTRKASASGTPFETKMSESGTTQITDFPAALKVYTNSIANEVAIELNGVPYTNGADSTTGRFPISSSTSTPTTYSADVNLQGIADGPVTMKVTPYVVSGVTATPYTAGIKQFDLLISGAPYVIVNNIFNGIVVNADSKLTCPGPTSPGVPCITGRVVNLPEVEYPNVVFTLNDKPLNVSLGEEPQSGSGIFTLKSAITGMFVQNNGKTDGKYTLKVALKIGGQLITSSSVDIFILSDNVPAINYLKPIEMDPLNPEFVAGSLPDTFVTRASSVQFQGQVVNSIVNQAPAGTSLYLRKAATTPVTGTQTIGLQDKVYVDPLDSFESVPYNLTEYGDYVFELVSANGVSGSTANKLITITREPVPYDFIAPKRNQIIKNNKGVDQANINQNYYMLEILADKADSVTIGKDQAILDKATGHFFYEVRNLKVGANEIKFVVTRGTGKTNGSIILFNTDTGIEGASYKTPLTSTMKIFDGDIQLKFPKDTKLMRNDRTSATQYITTDRQMLFGIANNDDGRIDKINESTGWKQLLIEPTGHFRPASKRFWVDTGIIPSTANTTNSSLQQAFLGGGILPNTTDPKLTPFYNRNYNDLVIPTERGTLTLKYDSNIRDDAWKYLTVYQYGYFNNATGSGAASPSWRNIGGVVDPKSNTITVPVDSFGYFQVMYMDDSYNDVTNHPWARDDLDTLYSKGLMNSKSPGQFMPNDAINRGEFVTMLVKIFDVPLENLDTQQTGTGYNNSTFVDVQRGYNLAGSNSNTQFEQYNFLYIEAAARAGIVRGNANGMFLPNNAITRQDAAVMIARAAESKLGSDEAKSLANLQKLFTDANSIDYYALTSVDAISKAGLIEGKENVLLQGQKKTTLRFDPLENFTRAEAAVVAMRVLKQQKKVPK